MTSITKTQCESLLEGLTDKTLNFGCIVIPFGKTNPRRLLGVPRVGRRECYTASLDEGDSFKRTDLLDMQVIGHPVTLLDVLERIKSIAPYPYQNELDEFNHWSSTYYRWLHKYWQPFGFKTPLSDILAMIEWEDNWCPEPHEHGGRCVKKCESIQVAKPSPATDLFQFLLSINL